MQGFYVVAITYFEDSTLLLENRDLEIGRGTTTVSQNILLEGNPARTTSLECSLGNYFVLRSSHLLLEINTLYNHIS